MAARRGRAARPPGPPPPVRRLLRSRVVSALAWPHGIDRFLEHLHPLWSVERVRARIVSRRREGACGATLALRPNAPWRGFRAGQWVRLAVPTDGIRRARCYSISSSSDRCDGIVEISVRQLPGGRVSAALVSGDVVGGVVDLSQAEGDFVLAAPPAGRVVFVSGGSGITPCMSILRTLADRRHPGPITFAHWSRTPDDLFFAGEFAALARALPGLDLQIRFTRGKKASPRPDADAIAALLGDPGDARVLACGPPGLLAEVRAAADRLDLADRLLVERFVPAVEAPPAGGPTGWSIRLARSGSTIADDGRPLLAQAEAAGLAPESGCRMGICTSCRCRKTSGVVRDLRTGEVRGEPGDDIRLCVSVPLGDVVLDL